MRIVLNGEDRDVGTFNRLAVFHPLDCLNVELLIEFIGDTLCLLSLTGPDDHAIAGLCPTHRQARTKFSGSADQCKRED